MSSSSEAGAATGTAKVACVTGASGYIASWIVKLLLARGYTVRATVRDPDDTEKTAHLRAMDGAGGRLHLFRANLLEEGSFDAAVDGCHCVFHTASPVLPDAEDLQAELIDPALKGTLNVLSSCKKASVERVILTSSMAAVRVNGRPRTPDVVVDETWFSSPEVFKKEQRWYALSKTLAEEAAWTFSKDSGLDLVTINPGWVIGPLLQPKLDIGAGAIMKLIDGTPTYPNVSHELVNVKDVAMAHVLAYEVPSAKGRYCMAERVMHYSELVKIIQDMYPSILVPEECAEDNPFVPKFQVSKDKIISLGIKLTPLETSIMETVDSLKQKGFVNF
ncbi:hypothetical protein QYE76_028421 [Lolium multiflorum]|uniref:NAD-dependent epimerase/dehydratase domain-containing protein n=1 Tax=Lolium multiflorum TaxID=4521 RepID=A0AAD8QKZ6_LOLMU|nr:hypothetical protein QYE76_028421 [Lolium multiflorum]